MARDVARQGLLATLAAEAVLLAGRRVLVLVGRKAALGPIGQQVQDRIGDRGTCSQVAGTTAGREARIEDLRVGRLDVLVATSLADEGLDVPELDCVVLGQPGKDGGKARQRSGRTTRPEGKQALVLDVVDSGATFARHWERRKSAYIAEYGAECIASQQPVTAERALEILRALG